MELIPVLLKRIFLDEGENGCEGWCKDNVLNMIKLCFWVLKSSESPKKIQSHVVVAWSRSSTDVRPPRCIWTTGWSAGPWTRQPAASVGRPGGQRRPRFAPCHCDTEAPPAAAASSSQTRAPGGPSRLRPGASRRLWYTAGRRRGWPASRGPGAVKPQRGKTNFSKKKKKWCWSGFVCKQEKDAWRLRNRGVKFLSCNGSELWKWNEAIVHSDKGVRNNETN